ncbi:cell division protein FtsQ/DivIB [Monashia sp. NPDC004114]
MLERGSARRRSGHGGRASGGASGGKGVSSSLARFERRAAAARRRPRVVLAVLVVALLLAGVAVWLGWFSSALNATTVEIRGVTGPAAAQVRSTAAVPLGGPLLRVDTDAVARRVVAGREWTDVSVSRSLPHTVVVTVTPRVAVLAVRNPQGQVDVVDREGFAFRTVASAPPGVPLVTSSADQVSAQGVAAALQALGSLEPKLRADVSGVTVSVADQVTFTIKPDKGARKTVVWGGAGSGELKAKLVKILLPQPGSTIDVSVPSSPVTR